MTPESSKYRLHISTLGEAIPLLRIVLMLRKFRVVIDEIDFKRGEDLTGHGTLRLDFTKVQRVVTVFKKIARLYDVTSVSYHREGQEHSGKIILK